MTLTYIVVSIEIAAWILDTFHNTSNFGIEHNFRKYYTESF